MVYRGSGGNGLAEILVEGLHRLHGERKIQGSKNAALPMMAAAVLHKGMTVLNNVPRIQDVFCMMGILKSIGCKCNLEGHTLTIDATEISQIQIPKSFLTAMRSSVIFMGALLGRCKEAKAGYPGGCTIGKRPIDFHLYALREMGTQIQEMDGELYARTESLKGSEILFSYPSVGATEQAILAGVLADGVTLIQGAAREPEIGSLCRMLNHMGAKISGIGTDTLKIKGVTALQDTVYDVPGDRIVAGTYLYAVMAAGGEAVLTGIYPMELERVLKTAEQMGANLQWGDATEESYLKIQMEGRPRGIWVKTSPYPGFPTDLQSPLMAVMASGTGAGEIQETVFEGRFGTAEELRKLGARIEIWRDRARIRGIYPLQGNTVQASDLRGGAALVIGGLAAEGVTKIQNSQHIFRGYEDICGDLAALGAHVRKENHLADLHMGS